jgi:hypothetical protein
LATFEAQVEALTGLAIESSSSNPTQAQLTQYITDGVLDVTNRCIAINPDDKYKFQKVSSEQTSNPSLQSKVTDVNSLHFASKFSPAYTIDTSTGSNVINVYPEPGSTTKAFKVYYVNNVPVANDNGAIAFGDSTIGNFPADKVYLVVLYGAIKSLESALAAKGLPTVAGESEELTAAISSGTIGTDADFADFSDWFETLGHMVEDEEDLEMAQVQIQKIATYLNAWQTQLQGNTTDYQWMQGRHQVFSKQYEMAFERMRPAQPEQGAK